MIEYEIEDNGQNIGILNINENINTDFKNSFIRSNMGKYKILKTSDLQEYLISFNISNVDDLYDIVAKYIEDNSKRFEEIERIKKYNKIKHIKKNTLININLLEFNLKYFNLSRNNIILESLFNSKKFFIDRVLELNEVIDRNIYYGIINEYNSIVNSSNYDFYTDEEKDSISKKYMTKLDELINIIENNTEYKYGVDFIIPIRISN